MSDRVTAPFHEHAVFERMLDLVAAQSGLVIRPEDRAGVLAQWRLNRALAAPLLAFDLPSDTPSAPVFRP